MWICPKCGAKQRSDSHACLKCYTSREGDPATFVLTETEQIEDGKKYLRRGSVIYSVMVLITFVPLSVFAGREYDVSSVDRWITPVFVGLTVMGLFAAYLLFRRNPIGRFLVWPALVLWGALFPIGTTISVVIWFHLYQNSVTKAWKTRPNQPLHGTPAETPSSPTEPDGRRP